MKEFRLDGKTALITGGGRGIGKSIALVLAEAGADIAVVARTPSQINQTALEIRQMGRRAVASTGDVAIRSQVERVVDEATSALGGIDILVNNAGIFGDRRPFVSPPVDNGDEIEKAVRLESWNEVLNTNLTGVLNCCQLIGPQMLTRGSGKVINIISNNAVLVYQNTGAYNPTKAAVHMMTKVMALEWAPYNVNVNAIGPGFFETEMTRERHSDPEIRNRMLDSIPLNRFADPRAVGLMALYFASPASDWVTGQVVFVDGGESAIQL